MDKMVKTQLLLFVSLFAAITQSQDCQTNFDRDSASLHSFNGSFKLTEPLVCGIRESRIRMYFNERKERLEMDKPIDWTKARCTDDHTLSFNYARGSKVVNNCGTKTSCVIYYLTFQCISVVPIVLTYDGVSPTTGNIISSHFQQSKHWHVTSIYVPYLPHKSGNYTFQLINDRIGPIKWFYIIFETQQIQFWKPVAKLVEDETYEDPRDSSKVVIPCQVNNLDGKVALVHSSFSNTYKGLVVVGYNSSIIWYSDQYRYEYGRGIVIDKTLLEKHLRIAKWQGSSQTHVMCVNLWSVLSVATVKVNFIRKPATQKQQNSIAFSIEFSNTPKEVTCTTLKNHKNTDFCNTYFVTSSDFRFVSKCCLTEILCEWNSFWTESGDWVTTREAQFNKKSKLCKGHNCTITEPYKSGLLRCSQKPDGDYVNEMYFTGLDNRLYFLREWRNIMSSALITIFPTVSANKYSTLYANETQSVSCKAVYFVLLPGFLWTLVFQNGTESVLKDTDDQTYLSLIRSRDSNVGMFEDIIKLVIPANAKEIKCRALVRDTVNDSVEARLEIIPKFAPKVVNKNKKYKINRNDVRPTLNCFVQAIPKSTVKWMRGGKEVTTGVHSYDEDELIRTELAFTNATIEAGNYTCVANNSEGTTHAEFVVSEEEDTVTHSKEWIIILACLLGVVAIAASFLMIRLRQRDILTQEDISNFLNGGGNSGEQLNHAYLPYTMDKEVYAQEFTIDKTAVIGLGFYGMVFKAQVRGQEVAAKTVKPHTSRDVLLALLSEIKILSALREHPNIVTFIGAHTTKLLKGEVYLFVELCPLGSVEGYLRKKGALFCASLPLIQKDNESEILRDLIRWSLQAANGMKYLSDCKVIHGDLAARNLLLKDLNTLKITDFGLARQLQNYSVYTKTQKQLLPWRHMAPESVLRMEYSSKSDVWSFGVTLWEMFSLGAVPYSGLQWTVGFTSALKGGLRLGKPSLCPPQAFSLLEKCWQFNPLARPDFRELNSSLEKIILNHFDNDYLQV